MNTVLRMQYQKDNVSLAIKKRSTYPYLFDIFYEKNLIKKVNFFSRKKYGKTFVLLPTPNFLLEKGFHAIYCYVQLLSYYQPPPLPNFFENLRQKRFWCLDFYRRASRDLSGSFRAISGTCQLYMDFDRVLKKFYVWVLGHF